MTDESAGTLEESAEQLAAPAIAKPLRKIAILGTTPSRMEGPVNGEDGWERWTIGPGGKDAHGWERLFETHTVWPEDFAGYLNDLSKVKAPQAVYSIVSMKQRMEHWAASHKKDSEWLAKTIEGDWSANVVIDRDALFEKHRRMWFSTSICYALLLAIEEGANAIGMWGIDLESDEEHIAQHMGCAHFLDLARLAGIDIHMPKGCGLERDLNPYPDRYETHLALTYEKKKQYIEGLLAQQEAQYEGKKMEVYRTEGALLFARNRAPSLIGEVIGRMMTEAEAGKLGEIIQAGERELVTCNQQLGQLAAAFNHLKGEMSATNYYQRMYVWGMKDPT